MKEWHAPSLLLLVILLLAPAASFAQAGNQAPESGAPQKTSPAAPAGNDRYATEAFEVTAGGDKDNRSGEPIVVNFGIKNNSGQPLLIRNIQISTFARTEKSCALNQRGEIWLKQDQTLVQSCKFDALSLRDNGITKRMRSVLLSSNLKLSVLIDTKELGAFHYYPSVVVPPQEYSIFIGGVLGALLLALFLWIERILKNRLLRIHWRKSLVPSLLMGLRGGIMAIIALLLGESSQGSGSPITLTVTDFSGGLLIGLFSYPLAAWITSALKLDAVLVDTSRRARHGRKRNDKTAEKLSPT